ncbi:ubiquitin carboxyl-terminal hydrolase 14 [Histomonas meleagridis]|uniref:ubiquitin carboxyl-terminal hydrolase 14 n=1 Tax=Histomonas meleagridis TaxID=135588 RepID=UPI003559DB69|nr:ubiquitin carboxyl-terminal hydrolase 14 [Histomonas meleagridis]KAH0806758.1 ubiquitin carboxyl-terminal hydrolase 14 [Histomonas meleagridis]
MIRRKQIHQNDDWSNFDIKENERIMLLGTAEKSPEIKFIPEDTYETKEEETTEQINRSVMIGLKNYGNTCYLNSVLQVFRLLPDVTDILKSLQPDVKSNKILFYLCKFITDFPNHLDKLVSSIRESNPLFNQKDPTTGSYIQQDAAECWSFLTSHLPAEVNELFQIQFQTISKIADNDEMDISTEVDDRLKCYIDSDTRQLEQGITFDSEIEVGESLITNHKEIIKLPKYLTIQLMRFCFKSEESIVAKKVRNVEHPLRLDTIRWLSQPLRSEIVEKRETGEDVNAGCYNLKAIITHKGRSANSGHYIAHVKVNDQWICFDDEKVSVVDENKILMLNGGADWHCSYLLVYE